MEKISRIVADDQRYYSPQTFNKVELNLARLARSCVSSGSDHSEARTVVGW